VRVIFAGTPPFAETSLRALHTAGFEIALVLTQPDRPAGRGKALKASAVKQAALELGLNVFQPISLKAVEAQQMIAATKADVMVVAAYGLILPKVVLETPGHGCLNIHASLLPRWRGAAPIQRAIQAGDLCTGITIMQMDVGLDTGPMISQQSVAISPTANATSIHDGLAELGANMIVQTLKDLQALTNQGKTLVSKPQPKEGVTYAAKLEKSEAVVDWAQSAQTIARQVHAFDPVPGSTARFSSAPDEVIKIWKVRVSNDENQSTVISEIGKVHLVDQTRVFVDCGQGTLEILEIQKPGGKRMSAQMWLQGQANLNNQNFLTSLITNE
jgi:methionyl-tRNA formyltransferase